MLSLSRLCRRVSLDRFVESGYSPPLPPPEMETTHAPQRIRVSASRSPLYGANSIFSDEHVTKMCGDVNVRELRVREPQHYTLEELHATCDATETNEESAKQWIDNLLTGTSLTGQAIRSRQASRANLKTKFKTLKPSCALPLYSKLTPFHSTEHIKPDVTIVTNDARSFPVLTVEVYSETWAETIKKTLVGVINHFRILRAHNPSVLSCTGFAFPKKARRACVAKITVTFVDFTFIYRIEYLKVTINCTNFSDFSGNQQNR